MADENSDFRATLNGRTIGALAETVEALRQEIADLNQRVGNMESQEAADQAERAQTRQQLAILLTEKGTGPTA